MYSTNSTPARTSAPPGGRVHAALVIVFSLMLALTGCVCQPGGRIVVNIGYRSAQGMATNILNQMEGGGTLTPKVIP